MNNKNIESRVIEIVARTFDVDPLEITMDTIAADVDGWDSLAHATLVIRLEKNFNTTLDLKKASAAQSLGDIVSLIEANTK
ncbi:acyl carrier protein [Burkholderia sp. LMG 21824]|uniref:acyl carrier protein n=1 Tax=Burkholderia sp. LMG 21824 TaxID=3158172 RepID=UPI003C2D0DB9